MPDILKSLIDGLDKVTDVLNIGRLLFYTAAGLCLVIPLAMCVTLLGRADPIATFGGEFKDDLAACFSNHGLWFAAVIVGFLVAVVGNAVIRPEAFQAPINERFYSYQYPRLFSGGNPQPGAKDYAAWLISEYYRFYEIAVFIPLALMLSFPVHALFGLAYLVRSAVAANSVAPNGAWIAFPVWTLVSLIVSTVIWPAFWMPRVIQKTYESWVQAKSNAIAGLGRFIDAGAPATPVPSPDSAKK